MAKRRRLGSGLEALLPPSANPETEELPLRELPVSAIGPSRYQPRRVFDDNALTELAASIKENGLIQPIVVRPLATGRYELLAGERRWRAVQKAGLNTISTLIRRCSEEEAACIVLIENLQRQDLNPIEMAQGLARLAREFDMTHADIARQVGSSRSAVTNSLRLLELTPDVQELMKKGHLSMGHSRALLPLPAATQIRAAERVVRGELSVRATELLVKRLLAKRQSPAAGRNVSKKKEDDPNINRLQSDLSEYLTAPTVLRHDKKSGAGTITIHYASLDALDGILSRIRRSEKKERR